MERNKTWLIIAILMLDLILLAVATLGATKWGLRAIAFSTASISVVTFFGLFCIMFETNQVERAMRNAIAGSAITTYLSIVGLTTFFTMVSSNNNQQIAPLTSPFKVKK